MSRRVHQAGVCYLHRAGEGEIFSSGKETDLCCTHAVEGVPTFGCVVSEVAAGKHISGVLARNFGEFRVGRNGPKSSGDSFLIYQS